MSRNTNAIDRNIMTLCSYKTNKMKCIINLGTDTLLMSSVDVDKLLQVFLSLELDSKSFTIMDYKAWLELDSCHMHHCPDVHHSESILM